LFYIESTEKECIENDIKMSSFEGIFSQAFSEILDSGT
jgi:hypothetical protein